MTRSLYTSGNPMGRQIIDRLTTHYFKTARFDRNGSTPISTVRQDAWIEINWYEVILAELETTKLPYDFMEKHKLRLQLIQPQEGLK